MDESETTTAAPNDLRNSVKADKHQVANTGRASSPSWMPASRYPRGALPPRTSAKLETKRSFFDCTYEKEEYSRPFKLRRSSSVPNLIGEDIRTKRLGTPLSSPSPTYMKEVKSNALALSDLSNQSQFNPQRDNGVKTNKQERESCCPPSTLVNNVAPQSRGNRTAPITATNFNRSTLSTEPTSAVVETRCAPQVAVTTTGATSRHRRQSICVPLDASELSITANKTNKNANAADDTTNRASTVDCRPPGPPDAAILDRVRRLVHLYLPGLRDQVNDSVYYKTQALLERDYGYPLSRPLRLENVQAVTEPPNFANFLAIHPLLLAMDECKNAERTADETRTKCYYERPDQTTATITQAPARLKLRYYCTQTTQQIPSREYERRYMRGLQDVAPQRKGIWQHYFAVLRRQQHQQQQCDCKWSASLIAVDTDNANGDDFDCSEATVDIQDEALIESLGYAFVKAVGEPNDAERSIVLPAAAPRDAAVAPARSDGAGSIEPDDDDDDDPVMCDPRVVAAERQLWDIMDEALHEYSQVVAHVRGEYEERPSGAVATVGPALLNDDF